MQSAQADVVINFVPNADFTGSLPHAAEVANGTTFSSTGAGNSPFSYGITGDLGTGRGTFTPFTLSETVGGKTFTATYTLAFDLTSSNTTAAAPVERGGVGALGVLSGAGLQAGETLTVSNVVLTNVSGDDVFQFDGFSGVFFGGTNGTETGTINGVSVTPVSAGNFLAAGQLISFSDVAGVDSLLAGGTFGGGSGTITLQGLQADFSVAIPEPSALLGLFVCGASVVLKRRRSI